MITAKGKKSLWIICASIIIKGSSLLSRIAFVVQRLQQFALQFPCWYVHVIFNLVLLHVMLYNTQNLVKLRTRRNHSFLFLSHHRLLCFNSCCGWFWLRKINVCFLFANKNKSCHRKWHTRKTTSKLMNIKTSERKCFCSYGVYQAGRMNVMSQFWPFAEASRWNLEISRGWIEARLIPHHITLRNKPTTPRPFASFPHPIVL